MLFYFLSICIFISLDSSKFSTPSISAHMSITKELRPLSQGLIHFLAHFGVASLKQNVPYFRSQTDPFKFRHALSRGPRFQRSFVDLNTFA